MKQSRKSIWALAVLLLLLSGAGCSGAGYRKSIPAKAFPSGNVLEINTAAALNPGSYLAYGANQFSSGQGLADKKTIRNLSAATQCVNAYFDDDARYVALDYANNDDAESFLNYAIVFQNEDELDQANILLNTTIGTGSLNFSGDMLTFEYTGEGITFPETDVFEASFIDREQRDVYDYRVTCVKLSDIDIHFKVESSIRGKTD